MDVLEKESCIEYHDKNQAAERPDIQNGYIKVKRIMDAVFAIVCLIGLCPVFIVIALFIKLDSKGPVIFKQIRIGRNEKPFTIYKFRTMYTTAPKDCPPYRFEDPYKYITRIGKRLRKSSLDELPQLINILKGEMSVIGPRPSTPSEIELIELRRKYYVHLLPPGLTGWAQINGRDEINIEEKVKYDYEYTKKVSMRFDIQIFFITIRKVLKRENIIEGMEAKTIDNR